MMNTIPEIVCVDSQTSRSSLSKVVEQSRNCFNSRETGQNDNFGMFYAEHRESEHETSETFQTLSIWFPIVRFPEVSHCG